MSQVQFSLPNDQVTKDLIERVQFSVSSRNAGSKVGECLTHVFVSPYCDDPKAVAWQHVSSGVTCLLRKKELAKNGRKMIWTVHMCLYNVTYGVLVWKGGIAPNSCYTAVADNFHVYVMHELNAIVGLLFDEASQAREMLRSYLEWDAEKVKEERGKSGASSMAASRFEKAMISKPCNFQHIQGTQALDECLEIEKIKTDIQAVFFGVGSTRARKDMEHRSKGGKRKKDAGKPRLQLQNISVPHKASTSSGSDRKLVHSSKSLDFNMIHPTSPSLHTQASVPMEMGMNYSMPLQSIHQSQPDLLSGYQAETPQPSGRQSPPYDSLPPSSEVLPDNQPQISEPHSPQYDALPLKETAQLPLQNGSGMHSPQYDSVTTSRDRPHSPIYDSLQKRNLHLVNQQQEFTPELFVDTIVDNEVSGYTVLGRGGGDPLDYTPPERLSPLNFEKEFSHAAFFHPSFVTSTTNC